MQCRGPYTTLRCTQACGEHFLSYQTATEEADPGSSSLVCNNPLDFQHQESLLFFPALNMQKSILVFATLYRRYLNKICSALTQSIYSVLWTTLKKPPEDSLVLIYLKGTDEI